MKLLQQALKTLKDTISSILGMETYRPKSLTECLPVQQATLPLNGYTRREFDYCYPVLIQLWRSRDAAECMRLKAKLAQRRMWYSEVPL